MAARSLTLNFGNQAFSTSLEKVSREALYGDSKVQVLGENGVVLQEAIVPMEGDKVIMQNCLGRGTIAGGNFTIAPVKHVDAITGKERELYPSSFQNAPQFLVGTPEDVLSMHVGSVYHLPGVQLPVGSICVGTFNYRASTSQNKAVILVTAQGAFLLVGKSTGSNFVGLEEASQIIAGAEAETTTEEDFFSSMA